MCSCIFLCLLACSLACYSGCFSQVKPAAPDLSCPCDLLIISLEYKFSQNNARAVFSFFIIPPCINTCVCVCVCVCVCMRACMHVCVWCTCVCVCVCIGIILFVSLSVCSSVCVYDRVCTISPELLNQFFLYQTWYVGVLS